MTPRSTLPILTVGVPLLLGAAAPQQPQQTLTVTVTVSGRGDYTRDFFDKNASSNETDHVEFSCKAKLRAVAPAGTPLPRMARPTQNVSCSVSGRGGGKVSGTDKEGGTKEFSASWAYVLKPSTSQRSENLIRFTAPGAFIINVPGAPGIEVRGSASRPSDMGGMMVAVGMGMSLIPTAQAGITLAVTQAMTAPGASFLSKLQGRFDPQAPSFTVTSDASYPYLKPGSGKDAISGNFQVSYSVVFNSKPAVVIVHPEDGSRRAFGLKDDSSVGTDTYLVIEAEAKVTPPELASQLEWTIEPLGDSKLKVDKKEGGKATLTLIGMPQENSGFGPRTLTAKVKDAQDSVQVKLFFRRDGKDHAGTGLATLEPNWSFYWRQTSAAQGHAANIEFDPSCHGNDADREGYFSRNGDPNKIYVCNGVEGYVLARVVMPGRRIEGIDNYGKTVAHEWEHRRQWLEWWGGHFNTHWTSCTRQQRDDPDHCDAMAQQKEPGVSCDCDEDFVPDRLEKGLALDSHAKQTHPGADDDEYLAVSIGEQWAIGSADTEDWSYPGKQWQEGK